MALEEIENADELEGDVASSEEKQPLNLKVEVASPSACQRHITVTIPREDIDRYYDDAYSEMMGTAAVPGFRAGRAPRKLVEARYRKDVGDQIKSKLLLDSMSQVNESQKLAAISEPDFDPAAIEVPTEGPMTFEFDLEVRPDFELPDWKGLSIDRPQRESTKEDVDQYLSRLLAPYGKLVPYEGPVKTGDHVTVNIVARKGDEELVRHEEQSVPVAATLSFRDVVLEKFDKLMKDGKAGDRRTVKVKLSKDATNEETRGKEIEVEFEILDVKKFELPELSHEFLGRLPYGPFEDESKLREAIETNLTRQLNYHQQQEARRQITKLLTEAASWELPPEMLKRQSERELQRSAMELRRSGFSDADIRAHENQLRQNSQAETARALREHFILERIAEEEKIEAEAADYNEEVRLIAAQNGESPRRIRAQLEKRGQMDALHNQIIERKVIERVLAQAKFKDVPYNPPDHRVEALDLALSGGVEAEIPDAEHGDESRRLPQQKDRS
ncbi:MAG: trigger factor [Planctomycetes bacterium]|nr:trigger factor [Planctomycetota bacterium]